MGKEREEDARVDDGNLITMERTRKEQQGYASFCKVAPLNETSMTGINTNCDGALMFTLPIHVILNDHRNEWKTLSTLQNRAERVNKIYLA
jgi:hypothetical protein